jgi:DNA-binding FadR family transcriptional regulator
MIADEITKWIRSGHLSVGDRLPSEVELSRTFKTSRPTVREAIIVLETDGFVEVRRNSGTYVINRLARSAGGLRLREIVTGRMSFEPEVCGIATPMVDAATLDYLRILVDALNSKPSKHTAEFSYRDYASWRCQRLFGSSGSKRPR